MSVKLTGADLKAFMEDKAFWTDGRWYEEAVLSINGGEPFDWDGEPIDPADKITWHGGMVYDNADIGSTFYDLETELKRWLKKRAVTVVVLEVDNAKVDMIVSMLKATVGVKVLK